MSLPHPACPTPRLLRAADDLPHGPGDRMADYIVDHMNPAAVRGAFLLKVALNAIYGVLSFYTVDVRPAWLIGGMFCVATLLNLYPFITLHPTKLIGVALALSVGACVFRSGGIMWAYYHSGPVPHVAGHNRFAHTVLAAMAWLGLASFGIATTLGATDQLGRRDLGLRKTDTGRG